MKVYRQNAYSAETYRDSYETWYASLSLPQQAAIYDYTDSGYRSLNHCLRYGKDLSPRDLTTLGHLDAALGDQSAVTEHMLLRAVKSLPAALPAVGQRMSFNHYMSTTSDPHQLFKFADHARPLIFEIHTTAGVPVSDIHDEYEFLLPRGTTFLVKTVLHGVDWHAEYAGTDYSRALHGATVITLTQEAHDPREEVPAGDAEPARAPDAGTRHVAAGAGALRRDGIGRS